jgi:hypothetical protein
MPVEHAAVRRLIPLLLLLPGTAFAAAQVATPAAGRLSPAQGQALLERALANELWAAQETGHPQRYVLHKSSPRLSSTKEIIETKDGAVARLTAIDDKPLSAADEQREQTRLDALLRDAGLQRHRKQSEDTDTGRALKVLRVLPSAFLYQDAGPADDSDGKTERFTFKPNPKFDPPDLETEVLTAMSGTIWIDVAQERISRLEGHLEQDVDFGWGILGRLYKGGSIAIEQAPIAESQWHMVRFRMSMSGRVFFKMRVFDTSEEETQFAPVPMGLGYVQAIQMLRGDAGAVSAGP